MPSMCSLQDKLVELMKALQFEDAPAGGSVVVYHDGEVVAECSVGQAAKECDWASDTLSLNYSTGKGVLVTLIHVLVSQGILDFDTPLVHYWASFASPELEHKAYQTKCKITLRDVLTHRANLFNIQSITQQADDMLDWGYMLQRVEKMPPEPPRNKKVESCYSALVSGWVLGGLIEKATNMTLHDALESYLAKPLGVQGEMIFGVAAHQVDEVSTLVSYFDIKPGSPEYIARVLESKKNSKGKGRRSSKPLLKQDSEDVIHAIKSLPIYDTWYQLFKSEHGIEGEAELTTQNITKLYFEMGSVNLIDYKNGLWPAGKEALNYFEEKALMAKIPAANNVASARALAKMYAMIANKGVWEGKEIIRPDVFTELSTVQVTGSDAIMAATAPTSMHWRLGYHRLFSRCHDVPNAFGHMGYDGSAAWCDTDRKLAVAFVHNYRTIMSTDIRQFAISEAILRWFDESQGQ